MNKRQRKEISMLQDQLVTIAECINPDSGNEYEGNWRDDLENIKSTIESMQDEEQDKLDNMPENMRWSQRADDYEEIIGYLGDAVISMDEAIECEDNDLESATSSINEAVEHLDDATGI